jgi:hypothetical protein
MNGSPTTLKTKPLNGAAGSAKRLKTDWQFYLLGGLRIFCDDAPLDAPPSRAHGLLAAPLLRPCLQARSQWAGLLFPELPEFKARQRND